MTYDLQCTKKVLEKKENENLIQLNSYEILKIDLKTNYYYSTEKLEVIGATRRLLRG